MIARFIYTDCESNGPFTFGVGKKFKSVVIPQAFAAGAPSIDSLKERLPKNSLSEGFVLPNVPNSLTVAEFSALPKSWAFAQITQDTFAFERITTAGQCYGRNNRFDEGFIFDNSAWATLVELNHQSTKPTAPRPVDFVHATGWLNPRGEAELEAATLSQDFYQLDPNFREQLKADLFLVRKLPNLTRLTTAFANSQETSSAIAVPKANSQEFFAIISILTRLTAPVFAWRTGFSDVWAEPRAKSLADGSNPHFILTDTALPITSSLASAWGNLAAEAFASGVPGKLMAKIDELAATTFGFNTADPAEGLSLLPLAVLLIDQDELAGKEQLVGLAAKLVEQVTLPSTWLPGAQSRVLDNAQTAVYRSAPNSETIERLLTNIRGAA